MRAYKMTVDFWAEDFKRKPLVTVRAQSATVHGGDHHGDRSIKRRSRSHRKRDVFVHISACEKAGYTRLTEGAKINYELLTTRSGKTAAAAAFACLRLAGGSARSTRAFRHGVYGT